MNTLFSTLRLLGAAAVFSAALMAQGTAISTGSLVRSSDLSSGNYTPSTIVMIENRARVLGNKLSASGTRYFAVTDSDLVGKKPQEVLQRLSPGVVSDTKTRQMEILVNLQRPLTVTATPDQAANIGVATISGQAARNIDVQTNIVARDLKIVTK